MTRRKKLRILFLLFVLIPALSLGISFVSHTLSASSPEPDTGTLDQSDSNSALSEEYIAQQATLEYEDRNSIIPPAQNTTVITSFKGPLIAFDSEGRVSYYNDTYRAYWDVDPHPDGDQTVVYSATIDYSEEECPGESPCKLNIIEKANLSTGQTERLYAEYTPGERDNEWHDVDHVGGDEYLVADMRYNRVFRVNTTTEIRNWTWTAQSSFNITSGGSDAFAHSKGWPDDWTHLNDVEKLSDGRVMVSLRNQDAIVFIDLETGVQDDWTLGGDGEYEIMYEQHNPDYIPAADGGPAVVIADSQNNRVIEFQRENGTWNQSWAWSDEEMFWLRDADRLPSGETLVTDTHSNRVFTVGTNGEKTWSITLPHEWTPYEAERLESGDESNGGPSAVRAELKNSGDTAYEGSGVFETVSNSESSPTTTVVIKSAIPNKITNGVLYVTPGWMGFSGLITAIFAIIVTMIWSSVELWWRFEDSAYRFQSPIGKQP